MEQVLETVSNNQYNDLITKKITIDMTEKDVDEMVKDVSKKYNEVVDLSDLEDDKIDTVSNENSVKE
jgi:hypothetical protein